MRGNPPILLSFRNKLMKKIYNPVNLIPASFLFTIIAGSLLLMLPFASAPGERTSYLTALFTATTSVCVTGLVVVDTYSHWSFFGQLIIAMLAQIGGLGMIAVAASIMLISKKKFTLTDRLLLKDSFNLNSSSNLLSFLIKVFRGTFIFEGIGAVLYMLVFIPKFGILKGIWASIFNAVSAFCNAGMDVLGANSLIDYRGNALVMAVTECLIIFGGLGFVVWFDLQKGIANGFKNRFSPITTIRRFTEHTKIVLFVTTLLLLEGMLLFLFFEWNNPLTLGNLSFSGKLANAFFESVTMRTAGFATIPQENLSEASCLIAYVLMFIGGSPVGTAGGVKTVTIFLLFMNVRTYLKDANENVIFNKRVAASLMKKAAAIVVVSFTVICTLTLVLLAVNAVPLEDALFEVVSACATVGLSRGLTASLNAPARLVIILAMYLGRIGPISMVAFFSRKNYDSNKIQYAEGNFYVG